MAISKVIFNGDTLMDVTGDNPATDNMLTGTRATGNDGNTVNGAVVTAEASDATPAMDGVGSAGTATTYSRGDHVHPSDTSKVSTSTTINGKALSSNINLTASDVGALPDNTEIPEKTSDLTNDSNFVSDANYVHTDNNFTDTLEAKLNGIAEGATVDDHKWNDVELNKSAELSGNTYKVPVLASNSSTSAYLKDASSTPSGQILAVYDVNSYLNSTTPSAGDSSTKVATTAFVGSAISTAISGVNSFEYEVVQSLPTTNIKDHTIYLVAKTGSTGDVYDEYLYINNSWEHIGSTDVDLSGYVPTTRKVNNKALSSDITLTASDVGALPDSTVIPAQISKLYTATCTTAAGTAAKVAILDDSTGFSLTAGVRVAVTFTYGNSATTPTLNVNTTGAKTIAIPSSVTVYTTGNGTTYNSWGARETVIFTYTGTYWVHDATGYLGYQAYNLANNAVPNTRTVNGKALSSNITLTASDVNALPSNTTYVSSVNGNSGAVTISTSDLLPSQTGQSGKYLTTNGTTASWGEIDLSTKQDKYTITTATISASGWSNAVYSALQTTYPAASYDLDIELNGDLVTTAQHEAWSNAQIVGSTTGNTIKALGTVPTIDIPVILKVTAK